MDKFENEAETTDGNFDFMDDSLWPTSDETIDDDFDFDLKITNLPPSGKIDHLLAKLAATRAQFASDMRSRLLSRQSSNIAQNETIDDDFELQIIDLPENEKPALSGMIAPLANVAARFSPQIRRKRVLSVFTMASVAVLAILVVFGGMPSAWNGALSLFARPTPTPAITSSLSDASEQPAVTGSGRIVGTSHAGIFIWSQENGTPRAVPVQDDLGPVPQNCPQNTTQSSDTPISSAFGGAPLWVSGFDGNSAALTHLQRANQPGLGWYQQITLLLQVTYGTNVVLQGASMNNNAPLLFNTLQHEQDLTNLLMLNPSDFSLPNPTTGGQQWIILTTNVYVPAAGCYSLSADWNDGGWTVYFAAGK